MKKDYIKPCQHVIQVRQVLLLTVSGDGLQMDITNDGATQEAE